MGLEERARGEAARLESYRRAQTQEAAAARRPVTAADHPDLAELVAMLNRHRVPSVRFHERITGRRRGKDMAGYAGIGQGWCVSTTDGDVDSSPFQRAAIATTGQVFTRWKTEFLYKDSAKVSRDVVPLVSTYPTPQVVVVSDADVLRASNLANRYWLAFVERLAVDLVQRGPAVSRHGMILTVVPVGHT